jgi:hypothetical protein
MADLILTCKCGQQMKVPEDALGKTGTCVSCGKRLKITKRNTSVFMEAVSPPATSPPLPAEREAPLTDAQKVTQDLTAGGVRTPPDWEELENLYAATKKAATKRSSTEKERRVVAVVAVIAVVIACVGLFLNSQDPYQRDRLRKPRQSQTQTRQPTMPSRQPAPPANKETAPLRQPIRLSGQGQQASPRFTLQSGLRIFKMRHNGTQNFAVVLMDGRGEYMDLLVNTIGPFNGSKAIRIRSTGTYILDITANGQWAVEIE